MSDRFVAIVRAGQAKGISRTEEYRRYELAAARQLAVSASEFIHRHVHAKEWAIQFSWIDIDWMWSCSWQKRVFTDHVQK
jgi:hypothetical protein